MDLKQYVKDAVRTESRIEKVVTDADMLRGALTAFIAVGNILDMIKKNVFYKREIDARKFYEQVVLLRAAAYYLPNFPCNSSSSVIGWQPSEVDINPRVFHAMIGAITESAEIAEALQKTLNGSFDLINVLEEFGDLNWYQAIAVDALDGDFQAILERNIAKLKARFPEKYCDENANTRDLEEERRILEGKGE